MILINLSKINLTIVEFLAIITILGFIYIKHKEIYYEEKYSGKHRYYSKKG